MSTRSQLRFISRNEYDGETHENVAQVYKHSDGYPSGNLSLLAQTRDVLAETGTMRDASYEAANFVFFGKLQSMGLYVGDELAVEDATDFTNYADLSQPGFLLGYGVEEVGRWHGDEEYLYEVIVSDDPWTVRVSEHSGFPRWDDLDEYEGDPWDEVEWAFTGSLDDAVEEFEVDL